MPDCTLSEFHMATPVGIPLEEVVSLPGMAMPKNGYVVPSDAPGFGLEIAATWITPWDYGKAAV